MDHDLQSQQIVALLTSHQQRLMVFVRSLVPQRADAEEIVQNVNLYIWQHTDEFVPGTDFTGWILRVAHFEVLTFRKRQARQRDRLSDTAVEQLASEAQRLLNADDRYADALETCLQKLSDKDRQLISLRYEPGATTHSVAVTTGRSLKAIYESLNRIRSRLLACIQRTVSAEERTS